MKIPLFFLVFLASVRSVAAASELLFSPLLLLDTGDH